MHSVMTCHDVSCYQSNPDHLWTTKDDAFRDVISACERCGESNEAPKFLFLRFFCFFHLRLHQSQVCCLLFVDLFLYVFDHFYFLRLFVVFVFLVQTFRWFRPCVCSACGKVFQQPQRMAPMQQQSERVTWQRKSSHMFSLSYSFYSWT